MIEVGTVTDAATGIAGTPVFLDEASGKLLLGGGRVVSRAWIDHLQSIDGFRFSSDESRLLYVSAAAHPAPQKPERKPGPISAWLVASGRRLAFWGVIAIPPLVFLRALGSLGDSPNAQQVIGNMVLDFGVQAAGVAVSAGFALLLLGVLVDAAQRVWHA